MKKSGDKVVKKKYSPLIKLSCWTRMVAGFPRMVYRIESEDEGMYYFFEWGHQYKNR